MTKRRGLILSVFLTLVVILLVISCSNDDNDNIPFLDDVKADQTDTIPDPVDDGPLVINGQLGKVEIFNQDLMSGDLIYRFGNPEAYDNLQGKRLFYSQHHPLVLEGEDQGKMMIFSNGNNISRSTVYELQLPAMFDLMVDTDNEPSIAWQFTNPELYAPRVSGAVPLSNGNVLITEGDFGLWEVTRDKEVVWKFEGDGFFWRGYPYAADGPEMAAIGLTF